MARYRQECPAPRTHHQRRRDDSMKKTAVSLDATSTDEDPLFINDFALAIPSPPYKLTGIDAGDNALVAFDDTDVDQDGTPFAESGVPSFRGEFRERDVKMLLTNSPLYSGGIKGGPRFVA